MRPWVPLGALVLAPTLAFSLACSFTALDGFSDGDSRDAADSPADAGTEAATSDAGGAADGDPAGVPQVLRLVVVDLDGKPLAGFDPLQDGATLRVSPQQPSTIEAITSPAIVGSVRFVVAGMAAFEETQNTLPYTINDSTTGTYEAWLPKPGPYKIVVTAHSLASLKGAASPPLTVNITVE